MEIKVVIHMLYFINFKLKYKFFKHIGIDKVKALVFWFENGINQNFNLLQAL